MKGEMQYTISTTNDSSTGNTVPTMSRHEFGGLSDMDKVIWLRSGVKIIDKLDMESEKAFSVKVYKKIIASLENALDNKDKEIAELKEHIKELTIGALSLQESETGELSIVDEEGYMKK